MKKCICTVILLFLLLSLLCIVTSATEEGMTFSTDLYKSAKAFDTTPSTFEAWVCFPETMNENTRGGVMIGNYTGLDACFSFEVQTGGAPRLYWTDKSGRVSDWVFRDVDLYTGKWTHLTIVRDEAAGEIRCYVNATLAQSVKTSAMQSDISSVAFGVGGDPRGGNGQYFKGRIKAISVYSDVRTEDELKTDMSSPVLDDAHLLVSYDFTKEPPRNGTMVDLSGNGYDATCVLYWMDEKAPVTDYAYSFAVIGDTQIITEKYPEKLACIYDWIVDHAEQKNIQFVMGLGDITNSSSAAEWEVAKNNIAKLDGVVPYSLVRGNHDSVATFIQAFPYETYADRLGGSYQNDMRNTWQELVIGDIKYLIMSLDYGAANEVLSWAGQVIGEHPEHNVIITTHAYLFEDGTTLDAGDVCPPATNGGYNNGDHMWDKLVSLYENIILVISGHHPCEHIIMSQERGVHGNTVTQMLVDPQGVDQRLGATGLVAMLYFSEDGRQVEVEYYSTVREQYFISENQFSFELAVVSKQAPSTEPEEPQEPTQSDQPEEPDQPDQPQESEQPGQTVPSDDEEPLAKDNTLAIMLGVVCMLEAITVLVLVVALIKKKK